MHICILSDSHMVSLKDLKALIQHVQCDYIIHCGDIYMTYQDGDIPNLIHVRGNNDRFSPQELTITIDHLHFFITHGHHYNVNFGTSSLQEEVADRYDVVCFGHSHMPCLKKHNKTLFINPGSLSFPRGRYRHPTYCILDTESLDVTFYQYPSHEICHPFIKEDKPSFFASLFKKNKH